MSRSFGPRPALLLLLLCVLTVASCRDTAPPSLWSRASRALTADPLEAP
ncbi:MAG TPA: hypothetical protein VLS89_16635 [Candidatus Nanopelagicales bacterium]|nr:hypothetical protein [Candidatus Nanopelagicales bacterium]